MKVPSCSLVNFIKQNAISKHIRLVIYLCNQSKKIFSISLSLKIAKWKTLKNMSSNQHLAIFRQQGQKLAKVSKFFLAVKLSPHKTHNWFIKFSCRILSIVCPSYYVATTMSKTDLTAKQN